MKIKNMENETEKYLRTEVNSLDCACNMVNEVIEGEYLMDEEEELYDAIQALQYAISNWQEKKKYI
jgi:hypothetical protein